MTQNQPVLIDFDGSVFDRACYGSGSGAVLPRHESGQSLKARLRKAIFGTNPVAERISARLLALARSRSHTPLILVVGGGAIGAGLEAFYRDPAVHIIGTDVYASANTAALADGHRLPFRAAVFDAVVIQAVLEHVLEPQRVVDEIHRVLKQDGLIYADTPFLQPVHEGAYDFTRFTQSGHRWLLRRFTEIEAGAVGGAGTALIWSVRHCVAALGAGSTIATLATMPFFWLRFLDRRMASRRNADGASGTYFLGQRSDTAITPSQIIAYYDQQQARASRH